MTSKRMGRQQPGVWIAGRSGYAQMGPRTDVELARQIRAAAWEAASRTDAVGAAKDRRVVALVSARYPKAVATFGATAIQALLRQPQGGAGSWDAYRILAAANGEPAPAPSPGLLASSAHPAPAATQPSPPPRSHGRNASTSRA
jgi:hypothetical protein